MKNSKVKRVYAGSREIADTATGELSRAVIVRSSKQDRNYVKMFLPTEGYIMRPKSMTLATVDLFNYLCVICGQDNIAIATTSEIAERIGMSSASIARAKEQIREFDYARRRANNVWMINPEIACKVDGDKRQALWEQYQNLPKGA